MSLYLEHHVEVAAGRRPLFYDPWDEPDRWRADRAWWRERPVARVSLHFPMVKPRPMADAAGPVTRYDVVGVYAMAVQSVGRALEREGFGVVLQVCGRLIKEVMLLDHVYQLKRTA